VRWDQLFADLEGQMDADEAAEHRTEVAERTRMEQAGLTVLDRLASCRGFQIQLGVSGVGRVEGALVDVAAEWLLIDEVPGVPSLVPARSWVWLTGVGGLSQVQRPTAVARRLTLGSALRALAQQRRPVRVRLTAATEGTGTGGTAEATGTIDRVYADHFDLAEHPADAPRRPGEVRTVRLLPVRSVAMVRPA
jgi:hypothetical protein